MKRYVIVVHGEYSADPEEGFYTGRFLKAESVEEAERMALELVTADPRANLFDDRKPALTIESRQTVGLFRWLRKRADGEYLYYGDGLSEVLKEKEIKPYAHRT